VLAAHSPVLMAIPGARIYELDGTGMHRRGYDELDVVRCWQAFLDDPERFLRLLHLDG
jgi:predicted ATPase